MRASRRPSAQIARYACLRQPPQPSPCSARHVCESGTSSADRLLASDAAADRGPGSAGDGRFGLDDGRRAAVVARLGARAVRHGIGDRRRDRAEPAVGVAGRREDAAHRRPSAALRTARPPAGHDSSDWPRPCLGLAYLAIARVRLLTLLAAIGWLVYVGIYTPLKSRSAWQTPIGAAAGAMPVLLGAAAGGQSLSPWALVLFGIVYLLAVSAFDGDRVALSAPVRRGRRKSRRRDRPHRPNRRRSGRARRRGHIAGQSRFRCNSVWPAPPTTSPFSSWARSILPPRFGSPDRRDDSTARWLLIASLIYLPAMLAVMLGLAYSPA